MHVTKTHRTRLIYYFISLCSVILVLLPTFLIEDWWRGEIQQQRINDVEQQLETVREKLNLNLQRYLQIVGGIPSLFVLDPDLSQQEFSAAVKHLINDQSDIRNIAVAPDLVIKYMYPKQGNEAAFGFDYRTLPEQLDTVYKSIETGKTIFAGPLTLVQGGEAFIARQPINAPDENGEMNFLGILSLVIDAEKFLSSAIDENVKNSINIAIKGKGSLAIESSLILGNASLFNTPLVTKKIELPVGSWLLVAEPLEGWNQLPRQFFTQRVLLYALSGLLLTLILLAIRALFKHHQSNFKYRWLIEESSIPYVLLNEKNKVTYINRAFIDAFGYSLKRLVAMTTWADITNEPERLRELVGNFEVSVITNSSRAQKNSISPKFETSLLTVNGTEKAVLIGVSQLSVSGHNEKIVSIVDISDRKQMEQELRESHHHLVESEARLKTILATMPDLVWLKDLEGVYLSCNSQFQAYLGKAENQIIGKTDCDFIDSERADEFRQRDLFAIESKKTSIYHEQIMFASDGHIAELEITNTPVFDENDQCLGVLGIARDVTQRTRNQKSLRIAALVFENSSEAMSVTDNEGNIIDVNPAFTHVTGYNKKEIIGRNMSILSSGKQDEIFYDSLWNQLIESGNWQGEIHNRRKNGEIYPQLLNINAVYDADNHIVQYIALFRDISEQHQAQQKIWHQANYDSLTELPNRFYLTNYLEHEIKKAQRHDFKIAVLFIDLDGFKDVNDSFGHETGDKLLKSVAGRLSANVREEDVLARQGGDEFIFVMSNLQNTDAPVRLAEDIIAACSTPFNIDERLLYITASVGLAFYPDDGLSYSQLFKAADQAMYAAKDKGKNRCCSFTPSMQENIDYRVQLINELYTANEQHQFELYYQPIVSLADSKMVRAEALIRWNHPERGMVSPADFIPIVEETRLVCDIGHWVFTEVCSAISKCIPLFGDDFKISLNISPAQLRYDAHHPISWPQELEHLNVESKNIVVEFTEGLLMDGGNKTVDTLNTFRDAGVEVAIDDFGTGYSSLAYIRDYDIDYLKIDRAFVKKLGEEAGAYSLCEAIISMAHKLGIKVIAEGVETQQQKALLIEMECDYAQGYLFSKPVPLSTFSELLQFFD